MPLAFYLDFATKQEGLRRFIDSKGLLTPWIGSLSCRPLPPSDNKGRDLAVIKQILHGYILSERKIRILWQYARRGRSRSDGRTRRHILPI